MTTQAATQKTSDQIDATLWPSYIIIVKLRPGFTATKLVGWATRKNLIELVGVHRVNVGYARLLHDALSRVERHHFNEPENEGDSEDLYDLLGF